MSEDVTGIIAQLTKLYGDSKAVIADFQHTHDAIVPPNRIVHDGVQIYDKNYRLINQGDPTPIIEHQLLQATLEEVDNYATKWIKSVQDLLGKVKQTRFKLQFDNPNQKDFVNKPLGVTTEAEDHLYDTVSDLSMRHSELRQIILELEKSSEQISQSEEKNIEPPVFKKTTKTLYLAGKAIRFNKNAEYTPILCEIILSNPTKLWALKDLLKYWDEYAYYASMEAPNDWQKVHNAIKRLNERIERATGIEDLFVFSTTSVRANPAYLKQAKK